jgi:hypothetical protein
MKCETPIIVKILRTDCFVSYRFEKKVNLRKFKGYVTEVQMRANEQHQNEKHTTA